MTSTRRRTSLRRTLSVRFCCTMLVALAGVAAWTYLGVRRTMYRQLDDSLRRAAMLQADIVSSVGSVAPHVGPDDRKEFIQGSFQIVALRDSAGRILVQNTRAGRPLPLNRPAFDAARRGQTALADDAWDGDHTRSIYLQAPPASGAAVLEIAASTAPLTLDLRSLILQMVGTVVLGSLATFIGAEWLASSSLEPLQEVLRQARAITGRRDGERIEADARVLECATLVTVLNDMLDRLESVHAWHRRVMRDLGHDLRTPITAMRTGVEVALWSNRRTDEYRRVLAGNLEEIERLTLISDALVLLGRLEFGDLVADRRAVDLRSVAADAVARVQQRPGDHIFVLARAYAPVMVEADPRLVGSSLDQLLDNAIQHTPPGTTIHVSVHPVDAGGEVIVEDNGPGVPEEVLAHIFERFYRGSLARGREAGPGLGLTLTAEIVRRHQGTIAAEHSESGGLRIRVRLPPATVRQSHESTALHTGAA